MGKAEEQVLCFKEKGIPVFVAVHIRVMTGKDNMLCTFS